VRPVQIRALIVYSVQQLSAAHANLGTEALLARIVPTPTIDTQTE
jgi:hypothetical protein